MTSKNDELRALIRSADPDGRPMIVDPTIDPARAGYYGIIQAGDPQKITAMVDRILDELEAVKEALRVRVAVKR